MHAPALNGKVKIKKEKKKEEKPVSESLANWGYL